MHNHDPNSPCSAISAALALARQAIGLTDPNPRVGCVLVDMTGVVIGQGHTQRAGGPHAEVMALRDAQARGHATRGATAYVTLEPCSHHGRTGPCCDALIASGITRIVASATDPNPQVAGQGFARLRAAGVVVEVGEGAAEARDINLGFFSRMQRRRPWVRMKAAASLDGSTALANGASQWITGPEARADGHAWRARASMVLTGIGTVLQDDPRLDVRLDNCPRQPDLVVVDSRLQTPPTARLFSAAAGRQVLVYTAVTDPARETALAASGATVVHLPGGGARGDKVDLRALLQDLARRGCNELHVESGHKLNGSLLREGLVDELLLYLAPRLLGPGMSLAQIGPLEALTDGVELEYTACERVGPDLRIQARLKGHADF